MKEYFARICYNTLDWKRPSGFEGKGVSKNIYERENGFGHEEWLFDESKIIDGYHYAFLQPMGCFTYAGEIVDVHLYCRSLMSGKLYLGILHNVECITSKQYKDAYKIAEEIIKNWYDSISEFLKKLLKPSNIPEFLNS